MKRIEFILMLLLTSFILACNSNTRKNIPKTGSFGDVLDLNDTFYQVSDTLHHNKNLFKGEILNYCKGEGCWLTLKNENGKPVLVEIKNKSFTLPLEINGLSAFVKGELINAPAEKYDYKIIATGITIK
ncbi:MAG: DUF4920 domain-containing protein [Bacteroidia bacterium]